MLRYEYKVVPAPRTPAKVRGIKGDGARFALTIAETINASAAEGWEFMRAETLPCDHRGWFRKSSDEQTLLIFRRSREGVEHEIPPVPPHLRTQPEPRLAAERHVPRRSTFTSLRAAPAPDQDGEPR